MTREEEIKKQAEKKAHEPSRLMHPYAKQYKVMSAYEIGFIEGAVWADAHPKRITIPYEVIEDAAKEVIDKDWQARQDRLWAMIERNLRAKFIAKACEWLKNYAYIYVSETTGDLYEDDLINDFRKDMRGD